MSEIQEKRYTLYIATYGYYLSGTFIHLKLHYIAYFLSTGRVTWAYKVTWVQMALMGKLGQLEPEEMWYVFNQVTMHDVPL